MLAKKILENLENGNYRIEYREKCDCDFYWHMKKDGEFVCDTVNNGGCYHENVLIMEDLAGEFDETISIGYNGVIATYDTYFGVCLLIFCSKQDIAKRIHMYIINDAEIFCDFIASLSYPEKCYPDKRNELHEKRRDKALIDYICS